MWDGLGSFGSLLGLEWYSYGTPWDISQARPTEYAFVFVGSEPRQRKGVDPSCGVGP